MKTDGQFFRRLSFLALGLGFLFASSLSAEDAGQSTRAVRLGFVQGQVQVSQGGQVIADPAPANSPLFEGTQVTAGDDGRAEIQFEDGSVARLSPNSSMTLRVLRQENGGNSTEIVLEHGLGYFELQSADGSNQMRVRFDDTVLTGSGFTVLRVDLDNAPGEVAVFSGNAHMEHGNSLSLDLHGGESVNLNASDPTAYNLAESIEPDSWDAWNADRDKALQAELASRTEATRGQADTNNPAWGDLDANGNWYNVPGQGYVWSPNDASSPGWDPYGNGNWMWTPGFGYIFVSGEPWGYMPYQCGAWNYYSAFGWGWAPGMGYCQPWWGNGGGWGYRIGSAPPWYRFPVRPRPHPGPTRPPVRSYEGGRVLSHTLIAVNHRPAAGGAQPLQARNAPVTINGHTVEPLHPVVSRQPYDRQGNGFMGNRGYQAYRPGPLPAPSRPGVDRPAYVPAPRPTMQPGYVAPRPSGGQPTYTPYHAPSAPPPSRPSGGAPAPAPRPSAPSGGGGGAPHVSSGGGGGGVGGGGGGAPRGGGGGGGGGPHH